MKASEMLSRINTLLSIKVNLAQLVLDNGTVIEAENWANGESVFIVTDDERVALPIGEYMIEDGRSLVVSEEGVLESIGEAVEEEIVEEDLEEEVIVEVPEGAGEEIVEIIEAVVAVVSPLIEEIKAEIDEMKKKLETIPQAEEEGYKDGIADEKEDMAKQDLSKTPARKPIAHNPERREKKINHLYSQRQKGVTTLDRVLNKLNKF